MKKLFVLITLTTAIHATWITQTSGVTSRLRGISAVSERIAWTSGSGATVLHTEDGGETWRKQIVDADPAAARLDFRDIDAMDGKTAYVLSIGEGPLSRIYKTTDGGTNWALQFKNENAKGFYDAMTFWDATHGLVIGDSIDGHFQILITENGGAQWTNVPDNILPPALKNEGAFAGSGTNIAVFGTHAWIGTGAGPQCRILHTADRGRTWSVVDTPIAASASSGIFSVAFRDSLHGVVVGGDYSKEKEAVDNVAITGDGGKTWMRVKEHALSGFRSAVQYIPGTMSLVAVGPQGSDASDDGGATWTPLLSPSPLPGFDTLSFAPGTRTAWASGNRGAIAKLVSGNPLF